MTLSVDDLPAPSGELAALDDLPAPTDAERTKADASLVNTLGGYARAANRGILSSLGSLPTTVADVVSYPFRKVTEKVIGEEIPTYTDTLHSGLSELGFTPGDTPNQRVFGDVAGGAAAAVSGVGLGQQLAKSATPVVRGIGQYLAASPEMQAVSGAGAGAGGGIARENGAGPVGQFLASLAGGIVAPSVAYGGASTARTVKSALTKPSTDLESKATAALSAKGIDFNALPRAVKDEVIKIGHKSVDDLKNLNPEQVKRMADFTALDIKPTQGWITRNPEDWWLENNLNTVDKQISGRFRDANQRLLDKVATDTGSTDYAIGNRLRGTIEGYDAALKSNVDDLYKNARSMAGRDIPLDPHRFINNASTELDQQMIGSKLPSDTLTWFQKIADQREPFDMGTALQRLQAINGLVYKTNDRAEQMALGIVKKHLTEAIEGYGGAPNPGNLPRVGTDPQLDLSNAFQAARTAAGDRFRFQESSPLVQSVLSDKFTPERVPDLIAGMKVDDLAALAQTEASRGVPVMTQLRDAAATYIRDAATLQGETGGSFTVNGLRKALDKIGPEKGRMLFGNDGWENYQQVLRVAGAINNPPLRPVGSTTVPNMLRLLQKVPIPGASGTINMVVGASSRAKQMADVNAALHPTIGLLGMPERPALPRYIAPGLLSTQQDQ